MGKRGGMKFRGGRGGRGGHCSGVRADYQEVKKENRLFEKYYNELGILEDDEKDDFWATMKRDLPSSFRFAGSKGHALSVQQRLKDHYVPEIAAVKYEDQTVEPPSPLAWFPDQLAWSMTTPKNVVRRFPPFSRFQKFLVSETSVGNISRQEVVSMIPPLLMNVKPGMTVLDMCAAPGSKAAQLIEMVHGGEEARVRKTLHAIADKDGREMSPDGFQVDVEKEQVETEGDWSDDGRATGLLIANDSDSKRSHMLVHQMKRLNSPNLIVMNHDATIFPSIRLPSGVDKEGRHVNKYLKFDRILADVPCSGDGTARKNKDMWRDWTPGNALGLHNIQVRILIRALQMLKVGGRVVYSTCSMNPVENEAVVSTAITRCGGLANVDLVDCQNDLPGLERRSGLNAWNVMDKQGRTWHSWVDVARQKKEHGDDGLSRLAENMFSPNDPSLEEDASHSEHLPLQRCMRVYGHLQDTGGFFIAVLEKKSEIKARPESDAKNTEPKSSVMAAIDEIEAKPKDETNPITKIEALDDIMPPQINDEVENPSAAERQNKENAPQAPVSPKKHSLDDEADAEASTKRIKIKEEVDEAAPRGEEDRQVHYPPPPGAQLDITRPVEAPQAAPAKKRNNQPYEEPFKYLAPDHDALNTIYDFYQLSPKVPRDRFMVRNATGQPVKAIYYTSTLSRNILTKNEGQGMKFVHCGVKMFVKQDVQGVDTCPWRIQTEGLPILESWVGKNRVVRLYSRATLHTLLIEMFPKVHGDGWKNLGEIGERVRDMSMGCCVLRIETREGEDGFRERIVLPLWRSLHSLNLMLPKEDRKAMLLRLYDDDSDLVDSAKDRLAKKQDEAETPSDDVSPQTPAKGEMLLANKDEVVSAGLGTAEDTAIKLEDNAASRAEDEATKTVELAAGVKDDEDVLNTTI
ncbi:MAG: hypothetical protein M1812_007389 [Candelaria pacifica]|nr:MAG: hypothetical protein M1812_007389 [Candelaria pacifica]